MLLGYDEQGRCPMFKENKCSIYDYRPSTYRTYDCRIFPATGVLPNEQDEPLIAQQSQRWEFAFASELERKHFEALQAAAAYLIKHAEHFPSGFIPRNATQLAVLAIKVYEVFLKNKVNREVFDQSVVDAIIDANNAFDE